MFVLVKEVYMVEKIENVAPVQKPAAAVEQGNVGEKKSKMWQKKS